AKPIPGPHEWYYERQVARWEMAALASKFCGWMVDLETSSIESNVAAIQRGLSGAPTVDPRRVLDFMQEWLPAISASEVF
ncbi:MAG: hypothetical protein ACREEX_05115, partial [Caulobacteraceae bacterium]